jgi:hypothetical protein
MTFWHSFLPFLFLVPLSDNARAKLAGEPNRLVADALAAEATWQAFPGFMAELEIKCNGNVSHGRVIVQRDGRVFVESVSDAHRVWAVPYLDGLVCQRLPQDEVGKKTWILANPRGQGMPWGRAVCSTDAPFGPCYWIQEGRFHAVECRLAKMKQRLTTLKTEDSSDNKHLPAIQVLHLWNAQTLELKTTETRVFTWRRTGGFDLPATIEVLSGGTAAETTSLAIGRIVITRHRLFSTPEPLFANK